jgi:membrane protease subunit (stomatin/prohibitin family)
LIVRPGQKAIFVHRGQVADVFEPGHYELKTDNLPLLGTLAGWKYGFNSPFRAEVYFISTKQLTDLKWGTPNPVMMRDPEFGPIRIRAFGTYALRAVDPGALLKELVGTDSSFDADAVSELLRSMIVTTFSELLSQAEIPALDMAKKYTEIAQKLRQLVQEKIDDEYGLELSQLVIVNISLPEAVEKALDTRTSMGVVGDLNRFQQYQLGQALGTPGGAGDGQSDAATWCWHGGSGWCSAPATGDQLAHCGQRAVAGAVCARSTAHSDCCGSDQPRDAGLDFRHGSVVTGLAGAAAGHRLRASVAATPAAADVNTGTTELRRKIATRPVSLLQGQILQLQQLLRLQPALTNSSQPAISTS